ncbi:glycoside hydrolase family 71 protein, partial [Aspergillus saccharolyticus JOP 1030-1]
MLALPPVVQAAAERAVFAHYMVGTTDTAHAEQDIEDAIAMGIDGFALNVQCPKDSFATSLVNDMAKYLQTAKPDFSIFISMDVYASGSPSCGATPIDYVSMVQNAMSSGYYTQVDGKMLVSTYSSGGGTWETWNEFKNLVAVAGDGDPGYEVYWVPDLDDTDGYWESDGGWWYYWGNLTDGVFSWESAWPALGQQASAQTGGVGGLARDQVIIDAAEQEGVSYMIPLSLMQYKNSYATNVYRQGEENFIQRMHDILGVTSETLRFVEYITWNDSPEGHYIGNVWPEQNTDVAPNNYANTTIWPHTGFQPIIQSFATAFKAYQSASDMRPQNGNDAVGAIWYHTLAFDDTCPFEGIGEYTFWDKPAGYDTFSLTTHWAIVLDDTVDGYAPSDLELIITTATDDQVVVSDLSAGLNFAQGPNVNGGSSVSMILAPKSGSTVLYTASGGKCPASSCLEGFYNLNYQVLPLVKGDTTTGCTYEETVLRYTPLNTTANVTIDCDYVKTSLSAVDAWKTSQAGLAMEFEITRHALSTSHALTTTLANIDTHFTNFTSIGTTDCADINDDSSCQLRDTCPSVNDYVPYFFAQRSFSIFQRCLREMSTDVFEEGFISALSINSLVQDVTAYLTPKSDEAEIVKIMGALAA